MEITTMVFIMYIFNFCNIFQHISSGTEEKSKLLPQNRHSTHDFDMDFYEPTVIPKGKCTLRQAFRFISQHKNDPIKYNSENIAAEYKIDEKIISM